MQSIDLFAPELNYQIKPSIAWQTDPCAFAIDTFSVHWGKQYIYAFPSPSFISLMMIYRSWKPTKPLYGIPIVLQGATQPRFPVLICLLVQEALVTASSGKESPLREHSFFRRRGGPEEFRGGSLTFCLPKTGGRAYI